MMELNQIAQHFSDIGHIDDDSIINNQFKLYEDRRNSLGTMHPRGQRYASKQEQLRLIEANNNLRRFFVTIQRETTKLLLSLMALDSNLIQRKPQMTEDILNMGTSAGAKLTSLGTKALSVGLEVPIPDPSSPLSTLVKESVKYYYSQKERKQISDSTEQIVKLSDIDAIAGGVARKLTMRYKDQINDLYSAQDAHKFAKTGAASIMKHVFSSKFRRYQPLTDELVRGASTTESTGVSKLFPKEFKSLVTTTLKTKSIGNVVSKDLYTKPGIVTSADKLPTYYAKPQTDPVYGFRSGTHKEAIDLGLADLGQRRPYTASRHIRTYDPEARQQNLVKQLAEVLAALSGENSPQQIAQHITNSIDNKIQQAQKENRDTPEVRNVRKYRIKTSDSPGTTTLNGNDIFHKPYQENRKKQTESEGINNKLLNMIHNLTAQIDKLTERIYQQDDIIKNLTDNIARLKTRQRAIVNNNADEKKVKSSCLPRLFR